jgi:PAS domain S-box-containing protein
MREISRDSDAYRFLMSGSDEGIYFFGKAIEDVNEVCCRIWGRTRDSLIGSSPLEFSPEFQADGSSSEAVGSARFAAAFAGQPQWFRWQYRKGGGEVSEALVHIEPVRVDGRLRLMVRWRNLLDLERAEHAVAETETRFQQILDHTPVIAYAKDRAGRYVFANREFARRAGVARERILGRFDHDLFPAPMAGSLRANDQRVLEGGQALEFEETVRFGAEDRTYLSIKFPVRDKRGGVAAVGGISTDITERKRADAALREAAIAVSSAEGARVFEQLARSLAAILAADVVMIAVHDGDPPERLRTLALVADGAVVPNLEYPMAGTPCAEVCGRDFLFIESDVFKRYPTDAMLPGLRVTGYAGYPLNGAGGESLGLIAVLSRQPLRDRGFIESMTKIFAVRASAEIERAHTEAALRASEASHRAIFESSEDAIFVHDYDSGAVVDVNPRACEIYGYTRNELLRASVAELGSGVAPDSLAEAAAWIERAKSGVVQRFEWHRRNKDGSLHWDEVVLKKAVIGGRPRILAFTREITARKLAEEALRASEEQYRAVFNAAVDGFSLWDAEGRVVDVNPAYARLAGAPREALLGSDGSALLPPDVRPQCPEMIAQTLAGETCRVEVRAQRADGSHFDAEIHGVVTTYQNRPHVLVMVRDLTERRRAEAERSELSAQLRQAQKMEALGQLTGGIAHDFNNLLAGIMGNLVLASDREAAAGDARLARYLDQAMLSSKKARDLIRQMLTYSRGRRAEPRPVELGELVGQSAKLLRASLPTTVGLETAIAAELPPANLDPVQVEQVLMNLAINARDAMRSNGTIRVGVVKRTGLQATCASCRRRFSGDFIELSVADSGPGVPPQVAERMFEPFFSTKEPGKGSGMGLSTVHGVVHEHHGHVVVESSPEKGATFGVYFPPIEVAAPPPLPEPGPARRLPRAAIEGRVLLVEDEDVVLATMRDLLEGWGLTVTTASGGRPALALFASDPGAFDLVVTDQTMPQVTGVELAQEITALRPGIPVILYTGYGGHIDEGRRKASGITTVLAKPVEPGELLATLRTALQRS